MKIEIQQPDLYSRQGIKNSSLEIFNDPKEKNDMGRKGAKTESVIFQLNPLASFSIKKKKKNTRIIKHLKIASHTHILKKPKEKKEKTSKLGKRNTEKAENLRSRRKHQRYMRRLLCPQNKRWQKKQSNYKNGLLENKIGCHNLPHPPNFPSRRRQNKVLFRHAKTQKLLTQYRAKGNRIMAKASSM